MQCQLRIAPGQGTRPVPTARLPHPDSAEGQSGVVKVGGAVITPEAEKIEVQPSTPFSQSQLPPGADLSWGRGRVPERKSQGEL